MSLWDMLVPQPSYTVHNLIRNPSFEYNNAFIAGQHQYWYYYDSGGTRLSPIPSQTSIWSANGSKSLGLSLNDTQRRVAYTPRETAFDEWSLTLSPTITTTTPAGTTYGTGNHQVCVMLLSPYGVALATMNDDNPIVSGTALLPRSGMRQIDLLRGHSRPFFTATFAPGAGAVATRAVQFTMPAAGAHDYPANSLGYAVFWSQPALSASGRRIWRLLTVKGGIADGATITESLPCASTTTNVLDWGRGSTLFLSDTGATPSSFWVRDDSGSEIAAEFVGTDTSQPAFGVSPLSVTGSTYKHHLYVEWFVDPNYVASTSPFIACACDYQVSLFDRAYGTTITLTNPETNNSRLDAVPSNRSLAPRVGRTKFVFTAPDDTTNTDAGRDLELRIEVISPTGTYTGLNAVLYLDNVQVVDITYRSDDSVNWNNVEFTYTDGDVAGGDWHDFAPSYRTSSGTTVDGINSAWYWLGTSNVGWASSFGQAIRDRRLTTNTVENNVFGGTSQQGYSQSAVVTQNATTGIYVSIDSETLGATVNPSSTGFGMPEIVTTAQQYGIVDGGIVQRQVASMRTMQMTIEIVGDSYDDLHDRRRRLINALKFDQLAQQGDRMIRYRGSGFPVVFRVTYTAGLEFTGLVGVSFTEAASIQFLCPDPYVYAERSVGSQMTLQGSLQDTRTYLMYRLGDNQPWVMSGFKDTADIVEGNGTVSMSGGSTLSGVGTSFSEKDIGKIVLNASGTPITGSLLGSVINEVNSTVSVVLESGATVSSQRYYLISPSLVWNGGLLNYHLGFIQSPVTNTVAAVVGGFDKGFPAIGYGMHRYLVAISMDGKQNTTAGNYDNPVPGSGTISWSSGARTVTCSTAFFTPEMVGNFVWNTTTPGGAITTSTSSNIVTGTYTWVAGNVGKPIYTSANVYIGTVASYSGTTAYLGENALVAVSAMSNWRIANAAIGYIAIWVSSTVVTLGVNTTTATGSGSAWAYTSSGYTPNKDYSSIRPLLTENSTDSRSGYYAIEPIAPISAMYQESPYSLLIAGQFQGYSAGGVLKDNIRLIRVKGWVDRTATTSDVGAPQAFSGSNVESVEILATDTDAGWGSPVIACITTDQVGNIYVGGYNFSTSYVWYIGRANDGTYGTVYRPLGTFTTNYVQALVTDNKFPIANVFAAIDGSPYIIAYAYYRARNSTGTWQIPPTFTLTTSDGTYTYSQSPDNQIYSFLKTESGDILVGGKFTQWGGVYGPVLNGLGRLVPKITTLTQNEPFVDALPAVPAAGTFQTPGVEEGFSIFTMANASYSPTTGSYSGTGERIMFGGNFSSFQDGRVSLGFGYLEGSGNASSVRRMSVSDLGIMPPPALADYPQVMAVAATNRNRFYYADTTVTKTDNLVGPTMALLITNSTNSTEFASNPPFEQYGIGGAATVPSSIYGIPQIVNVPVYVRGTANPYPVISVELSWTTSIYEIIQTETNARIKFDDLYGLRGVQANTGNIEIITIDFRPGFRSITSNIRGNLMQFVSPDSNFADFYLLAPYTTNIDADTSRINTLVVRYSAVHSAVGDLTPTQPVISINYTPKFWSFDIPRLYTDEPDTPLM